MISVLSCRDNAHRASMAQDGQLRLRGRLALMLHLLMCPGCRAYLRQIRKLVELLHERLQRKKGLLGTPPGMGTDARARILSRLHQQDQN